MRSLAIHVDGSKERPLVQPEPWIITAACPDDWALLIERCGGGFFHSPAGLWAGMPDGEPFFARLLRGSETAGMALGIRRGCRLSTRARHAYMPTLPALADGIPRDTAALALAGTLARQGSAEVIVDSFDACWTPDAGSGAAPGRSRQEYLVHLNSDSTGESLARRYDTSQRRHLRRGEREGWVFRALTGDEAYPVLAQVQRSAASRASRRGHGFRPQAPHPSAQCATTALRARWGMRTFAAFRSDTLLAAARIGWAGGRAFYCVGGSTREGYQSSAAGWLHWRIMQLLAEHGFSVYNLGGTAASAARTDDPEHGLFRFKVGVGADVVPCRGSHWVFSPGHRRAHELARLLIAPFRGGGAGATRNGRAFSP